jgi:hypothetical protein
MIVESFSIVAAVTMANGAAALGKRFEVSQRELPGESVVTQSEPAQIVEVPLSNVDTFIPDWLEMNGEKIRLLEKPRCSLKYAAISVCGWGIECPRSNIHMLPKEMARRFLSLFWKNQNNLLTEEERICWEYIIDRVDYGSFSETWWSAPHPCEGRLTDYGDELAKVEWPDGESTFFRDKPSLLRLKMLDVGERFSCLAQYRSGNVAEVLNVIPIGDTGAENWSWIVRPE